MFELTVPDLYYFWHTVSISFRYLETRMHSSMMPTGHSLTICRSLLPERGWVSASGGGGVCSGGVCSQGSGGVCSGECLLLEGVCSWGVSAPRGCLLQGGLLLGGLLPGGSVHAGIPDPLCEQNDKQVQKYYLCSRGVCCWGAAPRGVCACRDTRPPPPPVNRMTNRCKNITLATTSLQPVKMFPQWPPLWNPVRILW